jgi:hypothetical protein
MFQYNVIRVNQCDLLNEAIDFFIYKADPFDNAGYVPYFVFNEISRSLIKTYLEQKFERRTWMKNLLPVFN